MAHSVVLPDPWETDNHDNVGRRSGQIQLLMLVSQEVDQLIVHDLDDLLAGCYAPQDLPSNRPLPDSGDKRPRDLIVDVRLQKGATYVSQRFVDIGFGQHAAAAKLPENPFKLLSEMIEHGASLTFILKWDTEL